MEEDERKVKNNSEGKRCSSSFVSERQKDEEQRLFRGGGVGVWVCVGGGGALALSFALFFLTLACFSSPGLVARAVHMH